MTHKYYLGGNKNNIFITNTRNTQQTCLTYTVKPAYAVPSIKQSHVLKGHLFLFVS